MWAIKIKPVWSDCHTQAHLGRSSSTTTWNSHGHRLSKIRHNKQIVAVNSGCHAFPGSELLRWILRWSTAPHPYCSDSHRRTAYRTAWFCSSGANHVAIERVLGSPLNNLVTATLDKSLQLHAGLESVYKYQSVCILSPFSLFLYATLSFCSIFHSICFVYMSARWTVSGKHLKSIE